MKKLLLMFMILIVALSLGCSKSEPVTGPTAPAVTEPQQTAPETSTPATPTTTPTTTPASETETGPKIHTGSAEVIIRQAIEVIPFELHVTPGTEVTWVNEHVEGKKDREFQIMGAKYEPFTSDMIRVGETYSHTYNTPGTYDYVIVPGSSGKVIVEG